MNSTTNSASAKPNKPYADFPLFPHASGRWAKKIRGRLHYFGQWARREKGKLVRLPADGWRDALQVYREQVDDLQAGRVPRERTKEDGATMRDLCNKFLKSKQDKLDTGELSPATFSDYRLACDRLMEHFGKFRLLDDLRPEDFGELRRKLAKRRSLVTLRNNVNLCRIVIKFVFEQGLVDRPIRFGDSFDKPSKKNLRKARHEAGPKLFDRDDVLRILKEADPALKAMVLLGLNAGFGNMDCAELPKSAIDWEGGWLAFPRPKTGITRRCPLWPETVTALKVAISIRPAPQDAADAELCFLTAQGNRCVRMTPHNSKPGRYTRRDSIGSRFSALLRRLEINRRPGLGFYTLRHVFETHGGETKDQVAVDAIMGHSDQSMAAEYRDLP